MIGLVGCVKSKLDHPAPAAELYTSPLFIGRRAWVEQRCDQWFVISALHGLVPPDAILEPYEFTLKGQPVALKKAWAARVLDDIREALGQVDGITFSVHAGHDYLGFGLVDGLRAEGATVHNPVEGLGMGQQLQFYQEASTR